MREEEIKPTKQIEIAFCLRDDSTFFKLKLDISRLNKIRRSKVIADVLYKGREVRNLKKSNGN